MDVKISKSDIIWSYIAQFFNIGAGIITLPLILHMLSTEEIAMNYLMLTIGSMVALIDFGFAPQFGIFVSYVFSGAQSLEKQGVNDMVTSNINYHLLKCLIDVAKKVYLYMSIIVLIIMLTLGSWYIYSVTNGFSTITNSFIIWLIYSVSVYFNIYFYYYSSLLTGRGLIKEQRMSMMASKLTYILLTFFFLLIGLGLMGVCLANFISPFISRYLSHYYFYDNELKSQLKDECSSREELSKLFSTIWYNAKKLGVNFIGAYAILKFSLFIAGLYLSMKEVSSYGLMIQLVTIISGVSTTFITSLQPRISSLRVIKDKASLIKTFAWGMNIYYVTFIVGAVLLVLIGPMALKIIDSHAELPAYPILIVYLLITFLENNHGQFATFIVSGNNVPFVNASIITGIIICLSDIAVLQLTCMGLLGLVLVQGIVQFIYNNWYWPYYVMKEQKISFDNFLYIGFHESINKLHHILGR